LLAFYACLTGGLLSKGPQALAALAAAGVAIAVSDGRPRSAGCGPSWAAR